MHCKSLNCVMVYHYLVSAMVWSSSSIPICSIRCISRAPDCFPVSWNTFGTFSLPLSVLSLTTHLLCPIVVVVVCPICRHHHYPNHCHYCLFLYLSMHVLVSFRSLPLSTCVCWNFGTHAANK